MESDLESLKDEVWENLNKLMVDELDEICKGLNLTVEEGKQGKRSASRALVYRQLTSDDVESMEVDKGIELFTNVKGAIDKLLQIRSVKDKQLKDLDELDGVTDPKHAVPPQNHSLGGNSSHDVDVKPVVEEVGSTGGVGALMSGFAKMNSATTPRESAGSRGVLSQYLRLKRDFRINGTVGPGSKDSLSFPSLCYLIEQGKAAGYELHEIILGCINATKQGSLRFLLENSPNMTEANLISTLKIYYNGKQSVKLLNEMSKRYQGDQFAMDKEENEVMFCMRMIGYCRQITKLAEEEKQPMDESLIQKTFYESLATGFKQGAVRLELQKTLRDCTLTENQLLQEVAHVMNKEMEHKAKMEGDKNYVEVKEVDILNGRSSEATGCRGESKAVGDSKEGMMCSAINALVAQVSELTTYTKTKDEEIKDMKKQLAQCLSKLGELSGEAKSKPETNKKKWLTKCESCTANNVKMCRHCFFCGKDDHKIKDCPEEN